MGLILAIVAALIIVQCLPFIGLALLWTLCVMFPERKAKDQGDL